jgi:hypothetical protein
MGRTQPIVAVAWIWSVYCHGQGNNRLETEPSNVKVTARIIGVQDQIEQLEKMSRLPPDSLQPVSLRQEIFAEVLAASLQVDATTAQIDNEIAQANELRGYLADRRDRFVNRANLFSALIGGGMGAVSSGLQLPSGQTKPAGVVGIAGGTIASGLAVSGIRGQKGGTRVFDFNSNMLATLFSKTALPDSEYAPMVWSFLNEIAPTDADRLTRKERLVATWISLKRIDPPETSAGQDKINRVTSQPSEKLKLTIDDLEDRVAMLQDVRAKLSFLKRDLAELLSSLPQARSVLQ